MLIVHNTGDVIELVKNAKVHIICIRNKKGEKCVINSIMLDAVQLNSSVKMWLFFKA